MVLLDPMSSIWQNSTMFLGGVVVTFCAMWATHVKNAVSRIEMEKYVTDRLGNLESAVNIMNGHVMELKTSTARIEGSLGIGKKD